MLENASLTQSRERKTRSGLCYIFAPSTRYIDVLLDWPSLYGLKNKSDIHSDESRPLAEAGEVVGTFIPHAT